MSTSTPRVAVLAGGWSSEREVSLWSGEQVTAALRERGLDATMLDLDERTCGALAELECDCVFPALHGRGGEDGRVQGMLELQGLPYVGSGVLASALCFDKRLAAQVLAAAGVPVPEFDELQPGPSPEAGVVEALLEKYGLPVVVKPSREGSTIGLTIARDVDALASGIVEAARYDPRVTVQRFVAGTEITMGVLAAPELQVFPTLEIVYENPVYDYDAKYTAGGSRHIIPARIPEPARAQAAELAARAFLALGCEDLARVDMIVDQDGQPWTLEVNTLPGFTALSLYPDGARAAGIPFPELCERLVRHALARGSARR